MSAPADTTTLNLSGRYVLNKQKSDGIDEMLKIQGVGWVTRKAVSALSIKIQITHTRPEGGIETVVHAQELPSGKKEETHTLDWQDRDIESPLFGAVINRARRAKPEELVSSFLKEGLSQDAVAHGVVLVQGRANPEKGGVAWNGYQVWDIQEVDGERRFIKRFFLKGPKGEEAKARQVFDYLGP